jgi:hypothetical protein
MNINKSFRSSFITLKQRRNFKFYLQQWISFFYDAILKFCQLRGSTESRQLHRSTNLGNLVLKCLLSVIWKLAQKSISTERAQPRSCLYPRLEKWCQHPHIASSKITQIVQLLQATKELWRFNDC